VARLTPKRDFSIETPPSPVIRVHSSGPRRITLNQEARYIVTVQNDGDAPARGIVLNIRVPQWASIVRAGAQDVPHPPALADQGTAGVQWEVKHLAPGASKALHLGVVPRESRPFELAVDWKCQPAESGPLVANAPSMPNDAEPDDAGSSRVEPQAVNPPAETGDAFDPFAGGVVGRELSPGNDAPPPAGQEGSASVEPTAESTQPELSRPAESVTLEPPPPVEAAAPSETPAAQPAGPAEPQPFGPAPADLQPIAPEPSAPPTSAPGPTEPPVETAPAEAPPVHVPPAADANPPANPPPPLDASPPAVLAEPEAAPPPRGPAELSLSVRGPSQAVLGKKEVFRLTIANSGESDAEDVEVRLMPPSGVGRPIATHRLGTIAAGDSRSTEIDLVAREKKQLSIRAVASAAGGLNTEASKVVQVVWPQLKLEGAGPKVPQTGKPVVYTLRLSNPGTAATGPVEIAAEMPDQVQFVSASAEGQLDRPGGRTVAWRLPSLGAGGEAIVELTCILPGAGSWKFGFGASSPGLQSQTSVSTAVSGEAELALELLPPKGPQSTGREVEYVARVRNLGSAPAQRVSVVVYFSNGIEPVAASGGPHQISPGQVVFNSFGRLDAGEEKLLQIGAVASDPGQHVIRVEVQSASQESLAQEGTVKFAGN
jgi:uncharacterized repeat protein (TIGR01451 family)